MFLRTIYLYPTGTFTRSFNVLTVVISDTPSPFFVGHKSRHPLPSLGHLSDRLSTSQRQPIISVTVIAELRAVEIALGGNKCSATEFSQDLRPENYCSSYRWNMNLPHQQARHNIVWESLSNIFQSTNTTGSYIHNSVNDVRGKVRRRLVYDLTLKNEKKLTTRQILYGIIPCHQDWGGTRPSRPAVVQPMQNRYKFISS